MSSTARLHVTVCDIMCSLVIIIGSYRQLSPNSGCALPPEVLFNQREPQLQAGAYQTPPNHTAFTCSPTSTPQRRGSANLGVRTLREGRGPPSPPPSKIGFFCGRKMAGYGLRLGHHGPIWLHNGVIGGSHGNYRQGACHFRWHYMQFCDKYPQLWPIITTNATRSSVASSSSQGAQSCSAPLCVSVRLPAPCN